MERHFHHCPYCFDDVLCDDARCTVDEDDDLVKRGGHACCSDPVCAKEKDREEAMERLGVRREPELSLAEMWDN